MFVCIYVGISSLSYIQIFADIYLNLSSSYTQVEMMTRLRYSFIQLVLDIHLYAYIHTYIKESMCLCIYIYTFHHTYIHIYVHTGGDDDPPSRYTARTGYLEKM
jgi:hypothetical protein